jgi:hypothetical protein
VMSTTQGQVAATVMTMLSMTWFNTIFYLFPRQFPFLVYIMMSQVMSCHVTYLIHNLISDVILFWLIVQLCLFDCGSPYVDKQGQAAATQQGLTSLSICTSVHTHSLDPGPCCQVSLT